MIWKMIQKELGLVADGVAGAKTLAAVLSRMNVAGAGWKDVQMAVGVVADGIPGEKTAVAVAAKMGLRMVVWPTQAEVRGGKSVFGKRGDEGNLIRMEFPYPMVYDGKAVTSTRVHRVVAEPMRRIFERALARYGEDGVARLGLNRFGGCFNDRSVRGGSLASMHAWGIAMDIDPERNGLTVRKPKAALSSREHEAFWEIVEDEGAVSLGRERDGDWMHFQFARL